MKQKSLKKIISVLLAAMMLLAAVPFAGAEGAEPHGDGNGIVSRPLLASMYKWLTGIGSDFRQKVTFDQISEAVGKQGFVKEKSGEDTHAAYWTDGEAYVTVTFKNKDGYWGVTSLVISGMDKEEYGAADASFLPHIGNRDAGSSPTEPVTMTTKVKPSGAEATVTVQLPTENWFAKESFGELRYLIGTDESRISGNSPGLRMTLWSDGEALRAEQEKGADNLADAESLYLLGREMKGITYTKYGMDMTDYTAQLADNLFLCVSVYEMEVFEGTEAEAIINSLEVQGADFSFSNTLAGWDGWDDDPEDEPAAGGTAFNMDYITGSPWVTDGVIRLEDIDGAMMVYNNFSVEDTSFSHDMESDNYYSYVDFDIRVLYPDTDQPLPLLRLWFTMATKEASMEVSSVTFTTGGQDYTFSEVSDEEDFILTEEGDYKQNMLIVFDENSIPFLTELEMNHLMGQETLKTVFHGTRDIEVELGTNFWDVFSVYWELYRNSDAPDCLAGLTGMPMTAEPAQ